MDGRVYFIARPVSLGLVLIIVIIFLILVLSSTTTADQSAILLTPSSSLSPLTIAHTAAFTQLYSPVVNYDTEILYLNIIHYVRS